jgi:hypothetical protein
MGEERTAVLRVGSQADQTLPLEIDEEVVLGRFKPS